MDFTGERFTPECVREIWYEHWHRYTFALELAAGREVLDLACGEGYGSHLLASRARSVVGMDLSSEAIRHAEKRYQSSDNLSYVQADASDIPTPDDSFDLVVCFETIEHLQAQEQMLAEFRRVLRADGLLVISSPDKQTYSDDAGFENPFHVKELYREEFLDLLKAAFGSVRLLAQKLMFQSLIWAPGEAVDSCDWQVLNQQGKGADPSTAYQAMYFIALCTASEKNQPDTRGLLSMFGDSDESVYQHYHHEIRKNMQAGGLLAERDQEIKQLLEQLELAGSPQPGLLARLFGKKPENHD